MCRTPKTSGRKIVQSLKEIVNCSEAEIYAMLKECNMDPNEAVHRLLTQDTFHEVKSKREKKKEDQLLDRVLSVLPIKKDQLQMVGLITLLLASKYEDYWHPKISELISISANFYTRDQILSMEKAYAWKVELSIKFAHSVCLYAKISESCSI